MNGESGERSLQQITERLERLADELDGDPDEERTAALVKEASELAATAGREVERALRSATESHDG